MWQRGSLGRFPNMAENRVPDDRVLQVEAAHLCYMVAGLAPQSFDVAARLCLLGADHRASPRCFASVAALQRTEVLEWAKLPGAPCVHSPKPSSSLAR